MTYPLSNYLISLCIWLPGHLFLIDEDGAHMPAEGCIIAVGETECVTFESKDSRAKQLGSP